MEDEELEAEDCPWCGPKWDMECVSELSPVVECRSCGCRGPMYSETVSEAIKAWNEKFKPLNKEN